MDGSVPPHREAANLLVKITYLFTRRPELRGSEYTARSFQAACQRLGVTHSMGRPGSALDCGHRILALHLGAELRAVEPLRHQEAARPKVAAWIKYCNTCLRHPACHPDCPACPLNSVCPRLIDKGSTVRGI
jgi:hypothetical protein